MSREPAMDPILLEILWTRLISIVDEAALTREHLRRQLAAVFFDLSLTEFQACKRG